MCWDKPLVRPERSIRHSPADATPSAPLCLPASFWRVAVAESISSMAFSFSFIEFECVDLFFGNCFVGCFDFFRSYPHVLWRLVWFCQISRVNSITAASPRFLTAAIISLTVFSTAALSLFVVAFSRLNQSGGKLGGFPDFYFVGLAFAFFSPRYLIQRQNLPWLVND